MEFSMEKTPLYRTCMQAGSGHLPAHVWWDQEAHAPFPQGGGCEEEK